MKLYTRTGDDGSTGLFGGDRVPKDHVRIEAYGTVDELNAHLGMALSGIDADNPDLTRLAGQLAPIQSRLFDLGADLATPMDSRYADKVTRLGEETVEWLESLIDDIDSRNSTITTFVMPGGSETAARLHVARGACRRGERAIVTLADLEDINPCAVHFMNRLSDLLFAAARYANRCSGFEDVPWVKEPTSGADD